MINFQKLVLETISGAEPIQKFISDTSELVDLKSALQHFNIQQTTLLSLPISWYHVLDERILLRFTLKEMSKLDYINLFPYVDFLAVIKEASKDIKFEKTPLDKGLVEAAEYEFLSDFSSRSTGTHPFFNYIPKSNLLKGEYSRIRQEIVNSNVIGKMTIDNFAKNNFSIKKSIYEIINLRQDSPKSQIAAENKNIDDLLINPENYIPGGASQTKPIPTEVKNIAEKVIDLSQSIKVLVSADSAAATNLTYYITNKTIKYLQSSSLSEAKDVLDKLISLSNFIPKTPTKEWTTKITGLTQLAKGLSLGVKNMGT